MRTACVVERDVYVVYVVRPAVLAVHRDADAVVREQPIEGRTRKLTALVSVEDLQRAVSGDRFFGALKACRPSDRLLVPRS
jgi:hypothetical protein